MLLEIGQYTDSDSLKDWSEVIENIFASLAILIGGAWTLWRFGLFRERFAKIEFNLDLKVLGKSNDHYIIELMAIIENKGSVRQSIKEWTFDLLYLGPNDIIDENQSDINHQVRFNKKISRRPWVPNDWYITFIDGGTTQKYTYLTSVPGNVEFLSLYSRFIYPNTKDFHSAQKTFSLRESPDKK
jgi:hypothetical protein